VPAIARAVGRGLDSLSRRGRTNRDLDELRQLVNALVQTSEQFLLIDLMDGVRRYAVKCGLSGVLLILDELGKFLEYAALHPDREDIFVLQTLAEAAARSGEQRLVVLGVLHQGFDVYSERLPSTARTEWEKVAARYEEITLDQPLGHVAALAAHALSVDCSLLPRDLKRAAEIVALAAQDTGWYGSAGAPSPFAIYPLHPMVLPVVVSFFGRFGQNERSLFSFLLSSEPFGLQFFAQRRPGATTWYRLSDFYDYIRSVFGHRLAGASYRSQWLRISGTIDRAVEMDAVELGVLKAVGVLNLLDAEHLLATEPVLCAALADGDSQGVSDALKSLTRRGLLFRRGAAGGYCLWPSTSVNLESAVKEARRTLGPIDRVCTLLSPYLDGDPLLARRHYIETGTLRHFEVRYAEAGSLSDVATAPTEADGVVVFVLCESSEECDVAAKNAGESEVAGRPEILVAISRPLQGLTAELQDARCWQWIAETTLELAHDSYAAAEVARQARSSMGTLRRRLKSVFGFDRRICTGLEWWHRGKQIELPTRGGLSAAVSDICDESYGEAPRIRNELLNRKTPSSAAAAARLRLIDRIFSSADRADLGIEPGKAPPEKSMYLSVLKAGNVHREEAGQFILAEPPESDDPLRLRPCLSRILTRLEQSSDRRVPAADIFQALQSPPYGARAGVIPILLAIVTAARGHEIAVYEHGTFLQRFGASDFLRLTKQPATFEFQLCKIIGERAQVFAQLARVFADKNIAGRKPELLDVVRTLTIFAANLPEYSRRSDDLVQPARRVRDALVSAREPASLLFRDLPVACGLDPFAADRSADSEQVQKFVTRLREAMDDLRAAYPLLLERVRIRIARSTAGGSTGADRSEIAQRARKVALAAREPRLQSFSRCLSDAALSDDAWVEAIGNFVVAKPPSRWVSADEVRAGDEIDVLGALFLRVETMNFSADSVSDESAIRLELTRRDGLEAARIVRTSAQDESAVQELTANIEGVLADSPDLNLAAISRVLWNALAADAENREGPVHDFRVTRSKRGTS
jgi:hypothetical protein